MKRAVLIALLLLTACKAETAPQQAAAKGPPGGPPPVPPYQVRAEMPSGDRLAAGHDGEKLYSNRCGSCHLAGGMATNLITKQMLMAKRPPQEGLLTNRADLTRTYVTAVVRNGKNAMPRLTRVDVTEAELAAIAKYLGKAGE
jgi:mono/diheme cytochrome c family protein